MRCDLGPALAPPSQPAPDIRPRPTVPAAIPRTGASLSPRRGRPQPISLGDTTTSRRRTARARSLGREGSQSHHTRAGAFLGRSIRRAESPRSRGFLRQGGGEFIPSVHNGCVSWGVRDFAQPQAPRWAQDTARGPVQKIICRIKSGAGCGADRQTHPRLPPRTGHTATLTVPPSTRGTLRVTTRSRMQRPMKRSVEGSITVTGNRTDIIGRFDPLDRDFDRRGHHASASSIEHQITHPRMHCRIDSLISHTWTTTNCTTNRATYHTRDTRTDRGTHARTHATTTTRTTTATTTTTTTATHTRTTRTSTHTYVNLKISVQKFLDKSEEAG